MAILYEISEHLLKQAALIASKYDNISISDIIEECFFYGAKSLYSDAPKPKTEDCVAVSSLAIERINKAKKEYSQYIENHSDNENTDDIVSDISVSDEIDTDKHNINNDDNAYTKLILNEDGLFEL
jgi:hypothetical protein